MNTLKTTLLLAGLTALFVVVGRLVWGPTGMMIAFVLALVMNGVSYWFSDKIVLSMYHAREVTPAEAPELAAIVQGLAQRAGLPMPRLYIIPTEALNAFATGRNPNHAAVAVTEGILRLLSEEELEGVLAHELAHVKNRDILTSSIAATLAGAIMMLASMARWAMIFGGGQRDDRNGSGPIELLAMMILAPLAATLIQLGISRSREYGADATGAEISGDPEALARALEKLDQAAHAIPAPVQPATASLFIVNPFSATEGVLNLFSTHPSMRERIRRLRAIQVSRGWQVGARDPTPHAGS